MTESLCSCGDSQRDGDRNPDEVCASSAAVRPSPQNCHKSHPYRRFSCNDVVACQSRRSRFHWRQVHAGVPSADVPSHAVDANVGRRQLWRWTGGLDLVNVRVFEAVHAPSGAGLEPNICLLPAEDESKGDHTVALFFSDHICLRGGL